MAVQILYGRVRKKEIAFADFKETINLTAYLKNACGTSFTEETFMEDEEEITYSVITSDKIDSLLKGLTVCETDLREEIKETRGAEKKSVLLSNLKDVALMKNIIIKMLLQDCPNSEKILALI